jgi:hypothetical protein
VPTRTRSRTSSFTEQLDEVISNREVSLKFLRYFSQEMNLDCNATVDNKMGTILAGQLFNS